MLEVKVVGVRVQLPDSQPLVLLQEKQPPGRCLPIWVGTSEATAIHYAHQSLTPPRPMTHDLLVDLLRTLGTDVSSVCVTDVVDGVFIASLSLANGEEINARSSDAVAIALRVNCPIFVSEAVMDTAGVAVVDDDEEETTEEDEVAKFREFLAEVTAEDFHLPPGKDSGPRSGS